MMMSMHTLVLLVSREAFCSASDREWTTALNVYKVKEKARRVQNNIHKNGRKIYKNYI